LIAERSNAKAAPSPVSGPPPLLPQLGKEAFCGKVAGEFRQGKDSFAISHVRPGVPSIIDAPQR
jgi:hypothetical protein